jgi:RecA-family ATPase
LAAPQSPKVASVEDLSMPLGWKIRDLGDALEGSGQKPPWIIEDLLLAETATQISAHPHSMKSLAWLAAAIESVAMQTVWGHFDASAVNSSLFIESEDPQWMVEERIRGIAAGLGLNNVEDAPGFHYLRAGPFDLVKFESRLGEIFEQYQPSFVVLSTLQSLLSGRDWNEQSQMQAVNAAIVRLTSYCPIVLITHSPWDKRARRAAGTITQAANFVTTAHFEKVRTTNSEDTFVHVFVDSKVGSEQTDFTLKLETEGEGKKKEVRRIVYDGRGWPKGVGKEAVLSAIEDDPDATSKEIAERVGVSPRYVQKIKKKQEAAPKKDTPKKSPKKKKR